MPMSSKGIEHRAAKVSLVTGLTTIMSIVFQLVSVPVCLMYWGKETYGSWLALFSAFMLLRSLDAGYVSYVGNKLNYLYHQDNRALRDHLSSSVAGIALIGVLQLLLALCTLMFYPLAAMLGMHSGGAAELSDMLGLLVLTVSWVLTGSYFGIVHRLLIPAGLMFQGAWWAMLFQASQFSAIMVAALLRMGMLQTSFLFALSQMAIYVASVTYIKYKLPAYYPWWKGGHVSTGLKDLRQSMTLTFSNLIQQGATNGIVLMVSLLAGPATVPIFTTVRTLTNLWTTVSNVLTTPLLPDMVRFHAKGEANKLVATTEAHWVLAGSIVNAGVLLTYPLLPLLYGFWTGHAMMLDNSLLGLLLGSVVVTNAGAVIAIYLNGINSLRLVLSASVVRGVLGLGAGTLAYGKMGLAGFGLGILAGELVALFITVRFFVTYELVNKGTKMPLSSFAPTALSAGSVLLFLAGDGFGWFLFIWSWPLAFAGVMVSTVWGWKKLDYGVRVRLVSLFSNRITSSSVTKHLLDGYAHENVSISKARFNRKPSCTSTASKNKPDHG